MSKQNYKRLGDYIREVNVRNRELKVETLKGININKLFMPSVANTIGVDLSKYKIVDKSQFACNLMHVGRDEKIPIAINKGEIIIVSPAYYTFEVSATSVLMPEYLMLWFSRPEFDRQAWFYTDSDVRGGMAKESFLDMPIKLPTIAQQRAIVEEYEVLSRRIALNESICKKLEEVAQALYRKMFVDDIDPENLPEGWKWGTLEEIVDIIDGDRGVNYPSINDFSGNGFCLFLNAGNVTKKGFDFKNTTFITKEKDSVLRKGKLQYNDVVFTTRGTVGNFAYYTKEIPYPNVRVNSGMVIFRPQKTLGYAMPFVYIAIKMSFSKRIEGYLSGSAQPQLPIKDICRIPFLLPEKESIKSFSDLAKETIKYRDNLMNLNRVIETLQALLLSKLVTR